MSVACSRTTRFKVHQGFNKVLMRILVKLQCYFVNHALLLLLSPVVTMLNGNDRVSIVFRLHSMVHHSLCKN